MQGELFKAVTRADEKQAELDNSRVQFNDKLQRTLAELADVEKKLMQAQLQYENERSRRGEIESQLAGKLENEVNIRKQLDVEVRRTCRMFLFAFLLFITYQL